MNRTIKVTNAMGAEMVLVTAAIVSLTAGAGGLDHGEDWTFVRTLGGHSFWVHEKLSVLELAL
jgi:hypothetical protein